jgi:hypothetical protein
MAAKRMNANKNFRAGFLKAINLSPDDLPDCFWGMLPRAARAGSETRAKYFSKSR